MIKRLVILGLLGLLGCAHNVRSISEDYETLKGTLAAPPTIENGGDRIVLYIRTDKKLQDKFEIMVAVGENTEKEKVLSAIRDKLLASPNETVFLYGSKVDGPWQEYIDGIDFEFIAIGLYNPNSTAYEIILANYGTRTMDALRSVSWTGFIKTLGQAAIKKAL
jgi:hypothetical protein